MLRVAAIFLEASQAEEFKELLDDNSLSRPVFHKDIEGDIYYIVNILNSSSSSIRLSSREDVVIGIEVSQNDLEILKSLIESTNGQYVPQDEFSKWGVELT